MFARYKEVLQLEVKDVSEWKSMIEEVLDSKVREFHLLGYSRATSEDIWSCLEDRVWKGNSKKRLHEIVQDIFHLKSNTYMSYLTVNAYQDDDLMDSIAALTEDKSS